MDVYELPSNLFELARPILGNPPADLAYIDSGLSGASPARVFVDDPERPTTALMARTYEYYVGGARETPLADFIHDAPAEAGIWADFYGFVAVDHEWDDQLRALHPDLETIGRRSFRFHRDHLDRARGWRDRVPLGLRVVPMTAELAEKADREMPEVIGLIWAGYERFGERGFGALMLDGDRPVSMCCAFGVGAGEANLGVMTVPDYRRRGLATICSHACVEMAFDRGLEPTWDCDQPNVASGALALAIGFTEYPPFTELAFPKRAKPQQTPRLWTSAPAENGVVRWSRM
jgi:RimJ/RimL family protein N-acetyltransferase